MTLELADNDDDSLLDFADKFQKLSAREQDFFAETFAQQLTKILNGNVTKDALTREAFQQAMENTVTETQANYIKKFGH